MFLSRRRFQCRQPKQQRKQQNVLFSAEQFWGKRMMSSTRRRTTAAAAVVGDIDRRRPVSLSSRNPCIIQYDRRQWRPTNNLDMTNNVININNNYNYNYNHYNFATKVRGYSSSSIAKEPVQDIDAYGEKDPVSSTHSVVPQQQDLQQRQHQRQNKTNNINNKKKSQWGRMLPYQDRARTILSQMKDGTIPPPLIPQKVELCLESFLQQQYNQHNESSTSTSSSKTSSSPSYYSSSPSSPPPSLLPSDGPLARRLLDAALKYRRSLSPNNHVDTMPRLFSLCCQVIVRSGHSPAIDRVPNLLEHILLKGHKTYFARDATVTTPMAGNDSINSAGSANAHDTHQTIPREQQQQQYRTANTTTINKHGGLAYNTHHVNDACKAYINHVVVTNEKLWKQPCPDHGRDDISSPNGNYNNNSKISYKKQMQNIDRLLKRLEQLYEDPNVPLMQSLQMSETIILLMCHQRRPHDAYRRLQWMVEMALSSAAGKEQ
mmetsp:Transcript_42561/g.102608  ORF Transcript_42561/g.102608 Transcript_42561/m.102608 type:complete len:489 (+) Transcript_42561:205-1671(+)